ncbi:unnamed protein product [Cylindrotheca closterium]|uniref:PNPLA domain-containing protein n=1 Tax=Cylindrotheca closterium TaxID=2856 RepID=A0AAD2JI92_9STRA|nr:unnamed protein product [Cylindrotheca closterium]
MATSISRKSALPQWSLCFSGAGHLIVYHLGVAKELISQINSKGESLKTSTLPQIHSVAGSSSGALAAAALGYFPDRIEEYADRFLQDRGHAFRHFQQMLIDQETKRNVPGLSKSELTTQQNRIQPQWLGVATTECSTGALHMFEFDTSLPFHKGTDHSSYERLLSAVQASCAIPQTFHPWDLFSKYPSTYPDDDGIEIDGSYFVDGGIAAPCPVWHKNAEQQQTDANVILISPTSGSSSSAPPVLGSIRPSDSSFKFPLVGDLSPRGENGVFRIRPSVQNLRGFVASAGAVHPQILHDFYQRGIEDANAFWNNWEEGQG